jgi:hypothetical protein
MVLGHGGYRVDIPSQEGGTTFARRLELSRLAIAGTPSLEVRSGLAVPGSGRCLGKVWQSGPHQVGQPIRSEKLHGIQSWLSGIMLSSK